MSGCEGWRGQPDSSCYGRRTSLHHGTKTNQCDENPCDRRLDYWDHPPPLCGQRPDINRVEGEGFVMSKGGIEMWIWRNCIKNQEYDLVQELAVMWFRSQRVPRHLPGFNPLLVWSRCLCSLILVLPPNFCCKGRYF